MKSRRLLAALAIITMTFSLAAPAAAHSSGYCGHGRSGRTNLTVFVSHRHWSPTFHQYAHYYVGWFGGIWFRHYEYRYCPHHY